MSVTIPVVTDCSGCGACCVEQQSPPGYVYILCNPEAIDPEGPFAEDAERLKALPPEARKELDDYIAELRSDADMQGIDSWPCIWFDMQARRCRFHEHRPSICREFEIGSTGCIGWREQFGVKTP